MKQAWKHCRPLWAATALSLLAALALAGPASAHHHGDKSSEPAGTISSYDAESGVLTIDLAKGGSISALVTDRTRIELAGDCAKGDGKARHAARKARRRARAARRGSRRGFGGHGHHRGWGRHGRKGGTDDLTPGTVVDDAVLVLVDGTAVYAKVELESPLSGAAS